MDVEELEIKVRVKLTEKITDYKAESVTSPAIWSVVQSVIDGKQHDLVDSVEFVELKTEEDE